MKIQIAVLFLGALIPLCACAETVAERLAIPVLPGQELASYNLVYGQLKKKDLEADRAFAECRDPAALKKRQDDIRTQWIASFGGFPEKTPLNPVFGTTFQYDGYTVTKVRYESQPGHTVTALLYRPENPAFKPPHPCILMPCGHNLEGKAALPYQRAARLAAQMGFIVLSYDPIDQGERFQIEGSDSEGCVVAHNTTGARAVLLGWNTARFRIWDGIRSIDFLETLFSANAKNVGVMSYSGGGTLSSYLMCADPRVKAAAPGCFITSLRDHCAHTGPHDAEQNFFGQLAYGLNHAAFLLLRAPELPVLVTSVREDFFPIAGTEATLEAAKQAYANLGVKDINLTAPGLDSPLAFIDAPGKHDWTEGMIQGSLAWMRAKLMGDKEALPYDIEKLRQLSFQPKSSEGLLTEEETFCTPTGFVLDLPDNRTTFDLMRDQLKRIDRVSLSDRHRPRAYDGATTWRVIGQKAAIGKTLNFDRFPVGKTQAETLSETAFDGFKEIRQVLRVNHGEGMTSAVPMITFIPNEVKGSPALLLSQEGKSSWTNTTVTGNPPPLPPGLARPFPNNALNDLTKLLQDGSPVTVMDLTGVGEIGQVRKGNYNFEGRDTNENVAMMLYLLGRSMIEFQARELLAAVALVSETFNGKVELYATADSLAVSIQHAWAYDNAEHIRALFYRDLVFVVSYVADNGRDVVHRQVEPSWRKVDKAWQDIRPTNATLAYSYKPPRFPASWREAITSKPENRFGHFNAPNVKGEGLPHYLFSYTVQGALRYYDWVELSPSAGNLKTE